MHDAFKINHGLPVTSFNHGWYPEEIRRLLEKIIDDETPDSRDINNIVQLWRTWQNNERADRYHEFDPRAVVLFGRIILAGNVGLVKEISYGCERLKLWKLAKFPRVTRSRDFILAAIKIENPDVTICPECALHDVIFETNLSGSLYPIPESPEEKACHCEYCQRSFTTDDIGMIEFSQERDPEVGTYLHRDCRKEQQDIDVRQKLTQAIEAAGFEVFGAIRTTNEYGSGDWRGAWFLFDTDDGILKLGWRKRVIEINYKQIDEMYFPKTTETRDFGLEHVWSYTTLTHALAAFKDYRTEEKEKASKKLDFSML